MSRFVRELRARARGGSLLRYAGRAILAVLSDVLWTVLLTRRGTFALLRDVIAHPLIAVGLVKPREKIRVVALRKRLTLCYALNAGDILSISEVFFRRVYRLPNGQACETFVDLGANIGMASAYFFKTYGPKEIVCVEPSARNVLLLKPNLDANGVPATVLAGVIADRPGELPFEASGESNAGHIGASGTLVRAYSMDEVLALLPGGRADVVKVDIEGYEGTLLTSENGWLDRVDCLLIEFHDEPLQASGGKGPLIEVLKARGFSHHPGKSSWFPDLFTRPTA